MNSDGNKTQDKMGKAQNRVEKKRKMRESLREWQRKMRGGDDSAS